jgi:hypothetical protein
MSFLPDDLPIASTDLPTAFAKANGFSVGDDLLPELRGRINYDRPAEKRWKAYRGGGFAPCRPGDPGARLYLRIVIDVDRYGPRTIDVPPGSHGSLKEFFDRHRDERVRLVIAAAGKYFSLRFEPDDGKPMAEAMRDI